VFFGTRNELGNTGD